MSSQNSIYYLIFDNSGKNVGTHRQNMMCKRNNDGLEKYKPFENYKIVKCDENYDFDDEDIVSLKEWIIKNSAEFTYKDFEKGDKAKTTLPIDGKYKKVNIEIVGRFKGKWHSYYTVKTEDGIEHSEIQQTNITPIQ